MPSNSNTAPVPDSNPTPPPALQVVPAPVPKRHPGQLNKQEAAEVTRAEVLLPVCREAGAAAPLEARGIDDGFLTALEARIGAARASSTSAVNCTVNAGVCTLEEAAAEQELMQSLRTFQGAARLKFQHDNPAQLDSYLIGQRIDQSRPILEQSGQTIIHNADTDRPAPVDTQMITAAQTALSAYTKAQTPQTNERAAAKQARVARRALVAQIVADRQKMQTAADNAWPYTNPAGAGMRLKFRLPARRPYVA